MLQSRHFTSSEGHLAKINVDDGHAGHLTHIKQDLAPWSNHQTMAVGGTAILMFAGLGCCDYEAACFYCASSKQNVPMGLSGGTRKGGWDRNHRRTALGQSTVQGRES